MEIEVSAFGNFSTDTGSTDCNQVNINVFRFRRSRPSVPYRANFCYDHFYIYIVSVLEILFSFSFSISFTETNHFSMSLSVSYRDITGSN